MKNNRKRYLILNITLISLLILFVLSFVRAEIFNSRIDDLLIEFKESAILDLEKSNDKFKYYKVSRETKENRSAFYDEKSLIPGNPGDIIVDLESPFYIPILKELQTHYTGGHALFSYGDKILEITGNIFRTDNKVQYLENDYITNDDLDYFVGLRVKNMSEEDYKKLDNYLTNQIGKKYNYTFFFNRKNTFYCTDLVSRAYESIKSEYDLNPTKGFVTVQDLVLSKDTYIFMIKEKNNSGGFNIYYLE